METHINCLHNNIFEAIKIHFLSAPLKSLSGWELSRARITSLELSELVKKDLLGNHASLSWHDSMIVRLHD